MKKGAKVILFLLLFFIIFKITEGIEREKYISLGNSKIPYLLQAHPRPLQQNIVPHL